MLLPCYPYRPTLDYSSGLELLAPGSVMQQVRRGTPSAILYMSQRRCCHSAVGNALNWETEVYGSKSDSRLFLPDASLEAAPDIYQESATNWPGYAKQLKHSPGVPESTVSYNKLANLPERFFNSIKIKGYCQEWRNEQELIVSTVCYVFSTSFVLYSSWPY